MVKICAADLKQTKRRCITSPDDGAGTARNLNVDHYKFMNLRNLPDLSTAGFAPSEALVHRFVDKLVSYPQQAVTDA
jgi:hypothetical protein